ncbi:Alpha/Beta hydrolase protein [Xylaria arbuscula]|nr:Alpha/Beta hydrolase protein [Xylaria arbuscula]
MLVSKLLTVELLIIVGESLASAASLTYTNSVPGCGKGPGVRVNKRTNATLPSGRSYLFWIPPNYNPQNRTPLIFAFHGANKTPDGQADLDLLTTPFFNRDQIVVYPSSGTYGASGGRYWQGAPQVPADVDDVAYVLDILDDMQSRLCVDAARVYATGKSQGGLMVNNLACDPRSAARMAAFAPVSGSYYVNVTGAECTPRSLPFKCRSAAVRERAPILLFHGGGDVVIPFAGGPRSKECLPDIPRFAADWAVRDGLVRAPAHLSPLPHAGDNATVYDYGSGEELVRLVYDGDHVNHQWPATIPNADSIEYASAPATFNASSLIVEFFGRYTLRGCVVGRGEDRG